MRAKVRHRVTRQSKMVCPHCQLKTSLVGEATGRCTGIDCGKPLGQTRVEYDAAAVMENILQFSGQALCYSGA